MGLEHDVDVVPGLRHDIVQSFDMVVSQVSVTQLYTVVVASMPRLSVHDRAVIAQALAATRRPRLAFLVEAAPGGATAERESDADSPATAAAVAVMGASAGWETTEPLQVLVDGQRYLARVEFDGRNWRCRISLDGDPEALDR